MDAGMTAAKLGVRDTTATIVCTRTGKIKYVNASSTAPVVSGTDGATITGRCKAFAQDDWAYTNPRTMLTTNLTYNYEATTPKQADVENLFNGKTVKFFVKYQLETVVDDTVTFPAAAVPVVPAGATAVTTMGSVLAAVSLFALAAW